MWYGSELKNKFLRQVFACPDLAAYTVQLQTHKSSLADALSPTAGALNLPHAVTL